MLVRVAARCRIHGVRNGLDEAVRAAIPLQGRTRRRLEVLLHEHVPQLEREDRIALVERVQSNSHWDFDFIALMSLSSLIAAMGLIVNRVEPGMLDRLRSELAERAEGAPPVWALPEEPALRYPTLAGIAGQVDTLGAGRDQRGGHRLGLLVVAVVGRADDLRVRHRGRSHCRTLLVRHRLPGGRGICGFRLAGGGLLE